MKRRWTWLLVVGLGLVGVAAFAVWAGEKKEKEEDEQKISMDQVPAQAREALIKMAAGAKIEQVEKENENGVEVFEAKWVTDGVEHEAKVTADGKPVKEEEEGNEEEKITMDQVPAKAREALMKLAGGADITGVEKGNEDGTVVYEAAWMVNGQKHEAAVTTEGDLMSTEETLAAKDVPAAVRKAAEKRLAGAENVVFEKETKIEYEVKGTVNGKQKKLELTAAGRNAEDEEGDEEHEHGKKGKEKEKEHDDK